MKTECHLFMCCFLIIDIFHNAKAIISQSTGEKCFLLQQIAN